MFIRLGKNPAWGAALAAAVWAGLAASPSHAQIYPHSGAGHHGPVYGHPIHPYCPPAMPHAVPAYPAPVTPTPTPTPSPGPTTEAPTIPEMDPVMDTGLMADAGFGAETAAAVPTGGFTGVGYIDSAIPISQVRVRYDAAWDNNRPDRAEFFYPKCGCFRTLPIAQGGDPSAEGPPLPERSVDYQELSSYLEYAFGQRASAFVEVPIRWINPDINDNTVGLGDVTFGGKYALLYSSDRILTAQVRGFAPSGDGDKGLGTEHWSAEPALLYWQPLSERLFLEAEVRDWIAIGGSDFAGNVLRYGAGLSFLAVNNDNFRVAPVVEAVGWTVLDGKEFADLTFVRDATGTTIVNTKVGVRIGFGEAVAPGYLSRSDVYVGYGRALTGPVWYEDIARVEWRLRY